ncbi:MULTISPECIES: SAM-dependent methyltransferase [Streptomyces]|uniref:SAM-dependent methyltransferase n=1 Tax=Streptomyces TaxID=1883 RepID=UPI002FDC7034
MAYNAVPAYRDRPAAGGTLLDVGSGVGGALLTTLTMFPQLRAVGVERADDIVRELRRRAEAAGVASRMEIRRADARELSDEAVCEVAYRAQALFPRVARASTLAAVRRALVPGVAHGARTDTVGSGHTGSKAPFSPRCARRRIPRCPPCPHR